MRRLFGNPNRQGRSRENHAREYRRSSALSGGRRSASFNPPMPALYTAHATPPFLTVFHPPTNRAGQRSTFLVEESHTPAGGRRGNNCDPDP